MWKYELKATEIFKLGFCLMQCFNCRKYGHIAKACTAASKCGNCAGNHNTRVCSGNQEIRCCSCARKHRAWDPSCCTRIVAKAKTVANRTQDPGRYVTPGNLDTETENGWRVVGTRKRRAGIAGPQIIGADGQVIGSRRPGRPKKSPSPSNLFPAEN